RGFPLSGWRGEEPQKLVRKLTASHDSPCETSTRPHCGDRNLNNPPVVTEHLNRRRPIRRNLIHRGRHQPRLPLQPSATHPTTSATATSHSRSGVTNIHALNLSLLKPRATRNHDLNRVGIAPDRVRISLRPHHAGKPIFVQ